MKNIFIIFCLSQDRLLFTHGAEYVNRPKVLETQFDKDCVKIKIEINQSNSRDLGVYENEALH